MSSGPSRRSVSRYRMMPLDIESFVALSTPEYRLSAAENNNNNNHNNSSSVSSRHPTATQSKAEEREDGIQATRERKSSTSVSLSDAHSGSRAASGPLRRSIKREITSSEEEDMDKITRERAAVHQYGSIRFDPVTTEFLCWCSHPLAPKEISSYGSTEGVSCDFCGWTQWIPRKAKISAAQSDTFVSFRKGLKRERTSSIIKQEEEEEEESKIVVKTTARTSKSIHSDTTRTTTNGSRGSSGVGGRLGGRGRGRGRGGARACTPPTRESDPPAAKESGGDALLATTTTTTMTTSSDTEATGERKIFYHCDACGVDICPHCCEEVRGDERYYVPCLQCSSCLAFVRYRDGASHVCEAKPRSGPGRPRAGSSSDGMAATAAAAWSVGGDRKLRLSAPLVRREAIKIEKTPEEEEEEEEDEGEEKRIMTVAVRGRGRASSRAMVSVASPAPTTVVTSARGRRPSSSDSVTPPRGAAGGTVGVTGRPTGPAATGRGRGALWCLTVTCQEREVANRVRGLLEEESRLVFLPDHSDPPSSVSYGSTTRLAAERVGARVLLEAGTSCRCTIVKMETVKQKNV